MGISHKRLWTLLKYYNKLGLPNSTAMVATKIGIHTLQGIPIQVQALHLHGPVDVIEQEIEFLERISFLRRQSGVYQARRYYSFDLSPLYRTLDSVKQERKVITRLHLKPVVNDSTTARLYIEKALKLLGDYALKEESLRDEIEDWRYLADQGLAYLLKK